MHHPTDRIAHTKAFVIPVMDHWLKRYIRRKSENVLFKETPTHFIYGFMESHVVKEHSDIEKGNPLPTFHSEWHYFTDRIVCLHTVSEM